MALFDFFKKKKKDHELKIRQGREVFRKKEELKEKLNRKVSASGSQGLILGKGNNAWKVLRGPHITEKATDLAGLQEYVFKIYSGADKLQVKRAVQDLYKVQVDGVRIINVPRKKKRLGRFQGWRKGYKKAIVKLAEGQHIEILPR